MTEATMKPVDTMPPGDHEPPPGTAIVRPLRHVRAVRERYLQRFSNPAEVAASRSARAWAWALGESTTAPVTDQPAATPPTRRDIHAEIAIADGRRLRDEEHDRADAAAIFLRWLETATLTRTRTRTAGSPGRTPTTWAAWRRLSRGSSASGLRPRSPASK